MTDVGATFRALSRNPRFWVHIGHLLFIGPLIIYTGAYGLSRKSLPPFLAVILIILGLAAVALHAWMLAQQIRAHTS